MAVPDWYNFDSQINRVRYVQTHKHGRYIIKTTKEGFPFMVLQNYTRFTIGFLL
jgi:hypothetical protein